MDCARPQRATFPPHGGAHGLSVLRQAPGRRRAVRARGGGVRVRWVVHGERPVYESPWVSLALVDVEVPGGERFEHHVVRMPGEASAVVVRDKDRVLLIHRHRFITDTWGWEIPAGRVEAGEDPIVAAERETLEETGWPPGPPSKPFYYFPPIGPNHQGFHVYVAGRRDHAGRPL